MTAVNEALQRLEIIVETTGCEYPQAIECLKRLEALAPLEEAEEPTTAANGRPPAKRPAPRPEVKGPFKINPPAEFKAFYSELWAQGVEVVFLDDGTAVLCGQTVPAEIGPIRAVAAKYIAAQRQPGANQ